MRKMIDLTGTGNIPEKIIIISDIKREIFKYRVQTLIDVKGKAVAPDSTNDISAWNNKTDIVTAEFAIDLNNNDYYVVYFDNIYYDLKKNSISVEEKLVNISVYKVIFLDTVNQKAYISKVQEFKDFPQDFKEKILGSLKAKKTPLYF